MSLARMVGFLGPIDTEMLVKGQETHKYFTKEFDLYHVNEVGLLYMYISLGTIKLHAMCAKIYIYFYLLILEHVWIWYIYRRQMNWST